MDASLSIPAWPVSGLLVFSHLPWFVIAEAVLQTLEIVPCDEREGECVLELLVSWRIQVEAVAGFLLAHFVMLGVTFLIIPLFTGHLASLRFCVLYVYELVSPS